MATAMHVLVVDDDADVRNLLATVLESDAGARVAEAASGAEGMALLGREEFDVALVDVQMPDHSGLDVLRWARAAEIDTELIVLTAHADVETAVQAMRLGAYDFIPKPCKNAELREVVAKAAEKKALRRENSALKEVVNRRDGLPTIVGRSQEIRDVLAMITRVAAGDSPVLIHGESGTGKELVARGIHLQSRRAARPFVSINCGALPDTLLESELFGHKKGAFSGAINSRVGLFEAANGGTLWTRSARCRRRCRCGCSGCWIPARCGGWARSASSMWTPGWWPPPTRTCRARRPRAASAGTSSTASARS
jgi:DNA-binding NtrC family response regulator